MTFLVEPSYSVLGSSCPKLSSCDCYQGGRCSFSVCVSKGDSCIGYKPGCLAWM